MGFDKAKAIRAAEKHLAQGKIQAAIEEYRRIVEADAADYTALNTLGDLYSRLGQKGEALACFKRAAGHYRDQGFTLKAIAMYKKVTRFDPSDTGTALDLGRLYEQQGLRVEARAQYLAIADACAREGRTRDALDVLRRIADLDPSNTEIRLRLAEGYAREGLEDLAAAAYTDSGERLAARGEYEQALDAYGKALALAPRSHATLLGLVSVHTALGSADEAAEILEEIVRETPGDLELYAMLARAYVDAENAAQAERATDLLVRQEPTSYPLFFDVVRLYLQQGNVEQAAQLLARVTDQSVGGPEEEAFQELLQEVLARDPEQVTALHLLARVFVRQRDEERLRNVLERLADAAETAGDSDEERRALARLVRLDPEEARYGARLQALGGARPGDDAWGGDDSHTPPGSGDAASFETFAVWGETAPADADAPAADSQGAAQEADATGFEWEPTAPAGASPDAHDAAHGGQGPDDEDGAFAFAEPARTPPGQAVQDGFQEIDFGAPAAAPAPSADAGDARSPDDRRVLELLKQELESVDFYIAQGYLDIARDTLDMLERQFGAHADIEARRRALPADLPPREESPAAPTHDPAPAAHEAVEAHVFERFEAGDDAPVAVDFLTEAPPPTDAPVPPEAPAPTPATQPAERRGAPPTAGQSAGIDPGLAAIFDEFREAVEETEDDSAGDYETHYNMSLAYSEMGLLDQAVEELQKAIELTAPGDGTSRYLQCCNLLGHCFMQKGMPRAAAMWFQKGLGAPGQTEDEYQALRYELGAAYEQMGELGRALDVYTEVYGINVSYRGVSDKLRELQRKVTSDK